MMRNSDQPDSAEAEQGSQPEQYNLSAQQLSAIERGATLKELYGIPDNVMDTIYAVAYDKYQNGLLDEALVMFRFLLTQNIYHPDYALGLAAVFQRSKQYENAANLYVLAFQLGQHPQAMFYAGQCYLNLRNPTEAKACFIEATGNGADENLIKQAQGYLTALAAQEIAGESHV